MQSMVPSTPLFVFLILHLFDTMMMLELWCMWWIRHYVGTNILDRVWILDMWWLGFWACIGFIHLRHLNYKSTLRDSKIPQKLDTIVCFHHWFVKDLFGEIKHDIFPCITSFNCYNLTSQVLFVPIFFLGTTHLPLLQDPTDKSHFNLKIWVECTQNNPFIDMES